jgi:hypothetical protein
MTIQTVKIPFAKMSYTPDVPSAALGPNEYNAGKNVETDIRGIRSVAGDQVILTPVPGTPTYVTGGFRRNGEFWFVAVTTEGKFWASNGTTDWYDITPQGVGDFTHYAQNTNITECWNGNVLFLNDEHNPPMFWPDSQSAVLVMYSNQQPLNIANIVNPDVTHRTVQFSDVGTAPFQVGSYIVIADVNPRYYNGTFLVTACTSGSVTYVDNTVGPYSSGGTVSPAYTWNYNPNWASVYAKWMRLYNTPNVGSILVAGNLTATPVANTSTQQIYPVTIQWSQAFGLNQAPTTWTPTITNVANQLEVPLRGPAVDGFPCNGQFFLCSYWDTVVFSPLNFQTTSAPILGVRLYNQGRGLLTSNAWANTDNMVYGIDARDIWAFDGTNFTPLGNQRVKNWFYDQLDPKYYDRIWMDVNTQKNQIEIYYPDKQSTDGVPNKVLTYRYDIDCWNAPRDVNRATFSCEAPVYMNGQFNPSLRTTIYARASKNVPLVQKDQGFHFVTTSSTSTFVSIDSEFRRDNIKILPNYTSHVMVHRVLPEMVNIGADMNAGNELPIYPSLGSLNVTVQGANSVGSTASQITTVTLAVDANGNPGNNPWAQINNNAYRVNTLILSTSSTSTIWLCNAVTMQVADVEEDR